MSLEYPCVYFDKGWCRKRPDDPDACVFGPCDEETLSPTSVFAKWLSTCIACDVRQSIRGHHELCEL